MKVVIVGAGEVGLQIARQLTEEAKDVVIIERDPAQARRASVALDSIVLTGDATSLETLKSAGISRTDVFLAVTSIDEVNLISCFIVSSNFNVPIKIARVRSENYTKSEVFSSGKADIAYIINTEEEAANEILDIVEQGAASSIKIFERVNIQFRDYFVEAGSYFLGKAVKDIRIGLKEEFIIAGIVRAGELSIPDGEFIINEGDAIYIAADKRTFRRLSKIIGYKNDTLQKIAILGGTSIGVEVAEVLAAKGRSVMLIDKDYEHCKTLSEHLPEVLVINGEISDGHIVKEENLADYDAIICAAKNEELNILSGAYGKSIGIKRAVAVVETSSYLHLAQSIGIDSTVSPRFCALNSILKFIRKGSVSDVRSIFDGQAEAIEITLAADSTLVNVELKELKLPEDCRIIAVKRWRKNIIPKGNTVLYANDQVLFFVKRSSIAALEKLIS
ncbi:MAG: Trk system potassium transporter TrkA [Deferribacteraceae bacterium]|jgi:trk system potassium uptake protein TrkA|nr:Trk system potassium transporter TrkA [Deferribacteraceae bacterium]